jgi:NADPH:quinone reductase-like Zn-dependent oxidoreductase
MSEERGRKLMSMGISQAKQDDLVVLGDLLQAGKIVAPIDRCYPLRETGEAMRYVEDIHPQGKVVITVEP